MSAIRAYYNEVDPYAAQWLRNLIQAGLISAGDVDERDIRDVQADDLRGYTRCHWFSGIGVWDYALSLAGWPADRPVWTGSCPCQPLSKAGARRGAEDERHLWPAWRGLIAQCGPDEIFGEQVAVGIARPWFDAVADDLEAMGYACGAVVASAACFGAEHIRDRLWFVADAGRSGWSRSVQDGDGSPGLVQTQELQRGDAGLPARLHPRSDRASVRPIDGSARWVDAVHACGNAINAEAAAAFIGAYLDARPQGTAARSAETSGLGPQGNGPVGLQADAPTPIPHPAPDPIKGDA